jgi:Ser/Thr protein kinase RdoA (MazF antagonist)
MWNEFLNKLDSTTTPVEAARKWSADKDSVVLASAGVNLVFRFTQQGKVKYLRITHSSIRSLNELESAIDYQRHLFNHEASVCQPIISNQGNFIEEIKQDEIYYFAHVTDEVHGDVINFDSTNNDFYQNWGETLGILHHAAKTYQPTKKYHFLSWKDLWKETRSYLENEDEIIKEEFKKINEWFNVLEGREENFGLTHGDHRTGNVLYDGKHFSIIDFDEPVYHWYIADIVKPFLEVSEQNHSKWGYKFEAFLKGYTKALPMDEYLLSHFDFFMKMKSLDIYLWCKNNWHEPIAPGGKRTDHWLEELRSLVVTPILKI